MTETTNGHGATRRLHAAQGLAISETSYAPSTLLHEHHHEQATLSLVFRGGYRERIGRREYECGPYDFIYKPPSVAHSNLIGSQRLHALFVEVAADCFAKSRDVLGALSDPLCVTSAPARALVARARWEVSRQLVGYELVLQGIVLELWAEAARLASRERSLRWPSPAWLTRAHQYLEAHFQKSIGLVEVARAAGVHPVHLAQTFRRRYGCSVGEYVRKMRIDFASRALRDAAQPIGQIALSAGFADHSHFARTFRAYTGVTPSEYRRSLLR